jgi:hypothetical protein
MISLRAPLIQPNDRRYLLLCMYPENCAKLSCGSACNEGELIEDRQHFSQITAMQTTHLSRIACTRFTQPLGVSGVDDCVDDYEPRQDTRQFCGGGSLAKIAHHAATSVDCGRTPSSFNDLVARTIIKLS